MSVGRKCVRGVCECDRKKTECLHECVSVMEEGGKGRTCWRECSREESQNRDPSLPPLLQTMIVLEYMPKGDLRNYLLSRQPQ